MTHTTPTNPAPSRTLHLYPGERTKLYPYSALFPHGYRLIIKEHVRVKALARFGITEEYVYDWVREQIQDQPFITVASKLHDYDHTGHNYERWLLPHLTLVIVHKEHTHVAITCYPNWEVEKLDLAVAQSTLEGELTALAHEEERREAREEADVHNNIMATPQAVRQAIVRLGQSTEQQVAYRWLRKQAEASQLLMRDPKSRLELYRSDDALLVVGHKRGLREIQECGPAQDKGLLTRFGLLDKAKPKSLEQIIAEREPQKPPVTLAPPPVEVVKETLTVPPVSATRQPAVENDRPKSVEDIRRYYEALGFARCSMHAQKYPGDEAAAWLPKGNFMAGKSIWGTHSYCRECFREYDRNRHKKSPTQETQEMVAAETPVAEPVQEVQEVQPIQEVSMPTATVTPFADLPIENPAVESHPVVEAPVKPVSQALTNLHEYLEVVDATSITVFSALDLEGRPFVVMHQGGEFRLLTAESLATEPVSKATIALLVRFMLRKQVSQVEGYLLS